jgi:hypothetical protein
MTDLPECGTAPEIGANIQRILGAIAGTTDLNPARAVSALVQVHHGVLTGEGPTAAGRIHFSRTLDLIDAELCAAILVAAGSAGAPVTRAEAEVLFAIDQAATERDDAGRFDDVLAKAVAHRVLSTAGCPVPPREVALAPETPLDAWALPANFEAIDRKVLDWLTSHVRGKKFAGTALHTLAALLIGAGASPVALSLANIFDLMG